MKFEKLNWWVTLAANIGVIGSLSLGILWRLADWGLSGVICSYRLPDRDRAYYF